MPFGVSLQVADEVMEDLQLEAESVYLAQGELPRSSLLTCTGPSSSGTLRPDLIESASPLASARAHVIKTHHNDTQLVRELRKKVTTPPLNITAFLPPPLQGRVIEPLSEFHKDEVRALGLELGLPHSLVYRHPFPGQIVVTIPCVSPHLTVCSRSWTGH